MSSPSDRNGNNASLPQNSGEGAENANSSDAIIIPGGNNEQANGQGQGNVQIENPEVGESSAGDDGSNENGPRGENNVPNNNAVENMDINLEFARDMNLEAEEFRRRFYEAVVRRNAGAPESPPEYEEYDEDDNIDLIEEIIEDDASVESGTPSSRWPVVMVYLCIA